MPRELANFTLLKAYAYCRNRDHRERGRCPGRIQYTLVHDRMVKNEPGKKPAIDPDSPVGK